MKELFTVSFDCEVLTPMFLGSSDPREAELRPPSIKGAMRFWWRAMNGFMDIKKLYREEQALFGGVADEKDKNNGIGKSKLIIAVDSRSAIKSREKIVSSVYIPYVSLNRKTGEIKKGEADALAYFSYGKTPQWNKANNVMSEWAQYLKPNSRFTVTISSLFESALQEGVKSFLTLEYFGGLGGKSRNGFGSFQILSKRGHDHYFEYYPESILSEKNKLSSFPAFTEKTEWIAGKSTHVNWQAAIADVAKKYTEAKKKLVVQDGYKNSGVFRSKSEFAGMVSNNSKIAIKKDKRELREGLNRLPKPFYIKICRESSNAYRWNILYLPTIFLEGHRELVENQGFDIEVLQAEFLQYMPLMIHALNDLNKGDSK